MKKNRAWLYKRIGSYLKDLRVESQMTQAAISAELGYQTAQFISNIERGQCAVPYEVIRKLIKLYGASEAGVIEFLVHLQQDYIAAEIKDKKLK